MLNKEQNLPKGNPACPHTIRMIPKPLAISKVTFLDFEVDDVSSDLLPLCMYVVKTYIH